MVFYDTKQIEANLKLVGFENIKISDTNVKEEETGQLVQTKLIEAQKPKGKKNIDVEIEVEKSTYKAPYNKKEKYNKIYEKYSKHHY